jgi:Icc-related predicted phosphoesterase
MKILYTSDLHGTIGFYKDIIEKTETEGIDVILVGGDLLPRKGQSSESLEEQKCFIEETVQPFLEELKAKAVQFGCILGNNDWEATLPLFRKMEQENLLSLLHDQFWKPAKDVLIWGYPFIPPTPFPPKDFEKRDLKTDNAVKTSLYPVVSSQGYIEPVNDVFLLNQRSSIEEDLQDVTFPENTEHLICVMHAPPHDTVLDRLYNATAMGSRAIKRFIEEVQPFMTLHGHIHESPTVSGAYFQKIGSTISMNPGQSGGLLSAVIFDVYQSEETMKHTLYPNRNQAWFGNQALSS